MTSEQTTIKVSKSDLPFSCPPKGTLAWDMHPRVYIESSDKESSCPYCGAKFEFVED